MSAARASIFARATLLIGPVIALAFMNAAALRAHWTLDDIGTSRRYWEDMAVAFSRFETRGWGPTQVRSIDDPFGSHLYRRLRELVPRAEERSGVHPWEFWRTVEFRGFKEMAPLELRFSDDSGRSRLAFFGFLVLGGVAPYLPIWLPFLAFIPMAFWVAAESLRAGEGRAGLVFLCLLSSSAYLLETLTLPYSAAGFHLLAALAIVALSFFAFGPTPGIRGVWFRAAAASGFIHIATLCRSSSIIFIVPATVLLLVALARASAAASLSRRVLLAFALLLVIAAPRAVAPKQAHETWVGMWEGLGDFDREHGHVWSDWDARIALDRAGYSMEKRGPYWTPETEAIFKAMVVRDVTSDPFWYARILARRAVATLTQWRLAPTKRATGLSYLWPQHPAEGVTDTYYNFVKTADILTAFGRTWEAPLSLFWIASALFFFKCIKPRRGPDSRLRLSVVLAFALSALLMPVAVTTASGIETQVFVFVYLLCASFLVSDLLGFGALLLASFRSRGGLAASGG